MVHMNFAIKAVAAALMVSSATAHPGEDHAAEIQQRAAYMANLERRSLAHCAERLKARGFEAKGLARREAMVSHLRKKRDINVTKRDADSVLSISHKSSEQYSVDTPDSTIFSGNNSCILSPEVTEGPYYVSGEYVRQDVTDGQKGVPLTVDIQIIDMATCEPVPSALLEVWHCNSTGVYSGVVASGNGDSSDSSNLDNTFLRGIQKSNSDGVATFDSLVPGHYTGRTNHIHLMAHLNSTVMANNTITAGTVSHVGQIFLDQDLITQVEATAPYNTNTQELTTNAEDSIFSEEAASSDPIVNYVLLDESDISKGVFAWIAFGIDLTYSRSVSAAAYLDAEGGHANANSGGGGPGGMGGGSPPSGMPGGTGMPFGTATGTGRPTGTGSLVGTGSPISSVPVSNGANRRF